LLYAIFLVPARIYTLVIMLFSYDILFFLPEIYLMSLVILVLLVGTFVTAKFANITVVAFG